ncbi:MAG: hypothetical protein ACI4II_07850 [Acutalibacteraceae bacterium]
MKKITCLLLSLILIACMGGCATIKLPNLGGNTPNTSGPNTDNVNKITIPAGTKAVVGETNGRGFSFLCKDTYRTDKNDDRGSMVYCDASNELPNLSVKVLNESSLNAKDYLENKFTPEMQSKFAERFISVTNVADYTYNDRSLPYVIYSYSAIEGGTLCCTCLLDVQSDYAVIYAMECPVDDADAVVESLNLALDTFKLDAKYYDGAIVGNASSSAPSDDKENESYGVYKVSKNTETLPVTEKYDNNLISMNIPHGWQVAIAEADYIHYTFKVYDPKDPNYQIFVNLKLEGFLKSKEAKQWYIDNYGKDYVFSKSVVLENKTTTGTYEVFNDISDFVSTERFKFPYMNDFTVLENYGKTPLGGDLLHAKYKDDAGKTVEGIFTSTVADIGTYYVNVRPWDFTSPQIDAWYMNVYSTIFYTTPEGELARWQSLLDSCFSSLQYSDTFMEGFNAQEDAVLSSIQSNAKVYSGISDMIMSSWENRNNSYDIISQKNSDATLGYDRLIDPDTNTIYRAETGFYDEYNTNRDSYSNGNLQLIDSYDEKYYLESVDYYITK